jgi:hypothetical protein
MDSLVTCQTTTIETNEISVHITLIRPIDTLLKHTFQFDTMRNIIRLTRSIVTHVDEYIHVNNVYVRVYTFRRQSRFDPIEKEMRSYR